MSAPEVTTPAVVECTVRGCGWRAEIPLLYRLELLDYGHAFAPMHWRTSTRVVVDEAAVAAFDAYVAGHLVQHAVAETALAHPDDPMRLETSPFDPRLGT